MPKKPDQYKRDANGRILPESPKVECTCAFCGKTFFRRLSKVQKTSHVFCSQECRGKHVETENLKKSMLSKEEFLTEIQAPEMLRCAAFAAKRMKHMYPSVEQYSQEELWQEMMIAIWKYGKQTQDTDKGNKWSFYITAFRHAMLRLLHTDSWNPGETSLEELSLEDIDQICCSNTPLDIGTRMILREIEQKAVTQKKWKWFYEHYINDMTSFEIAAMESESRSKVSCAIARARKTLIAKYSQD